MIYEFTTSEKDVSRVNRQEWLLTFFAFLFKRSPMCNMSFGFVRIVEPTCGLVAVVHGKHAQR